MISAPLMEGPPGPETIIDGVRYLYFGGTSYLGLAGHPEVIEAGCEALRCFGVHSATSRAGFGNTAPVLEVERRAAQFFGTEDAFYFSSGYAANHIMIAALAPEMDAVLVDEAAHYCVGEAARLAGLPLLPVRHQDPEDLARKASGRSRVLFMTDAVGPSSGRLAPLADYMTALAGTDQASILLDDAHGFGVLGDQGRGLVDQHGLWSRVNGGRTPEGAPRLYVCGTLAKALGGFGGIVPGTAGFVEKARRSSHYYDGASAPAAPVAGATARALEIVLRDPSLRVRLKANTRRLRAGLRDLGLEIPEGDAANFGVCTGDSDEMLRIHQSLRARGVLVPYIASYSGIPKQGVLRFAVFATHSADQIDRLIEELRPLL